MPVRLHSCPWCESKDVYPVWPETHYDRCRSCGLFFRNPMPTREELDNLYADSWSAPEVATSETGGTDERLAVIFARRLARSIRRQDFRGLRILDFGAGRGAMLNALKNMGAAVVGIEPYGTKYLQERGFEAYQDLLELSGSFDGVVMIDVWEHLHKPWERVKELQNFLRPGGWIYIATPNPQGVNARVSKGVWREAKKPGHLMFPSTKLMEDSLRWAGFSEIHRLRWLVRFTNNPFKTLIHFTLQLLELDGELRYLAWK